MSLAFPLKGWCAVDRALGVRCCVCRMDMGMGAVALLGPLFVRSFPSVPSLLGGVCCGCRYICVHRCMYVERCVRRCGYGHMYGCMRGFFVRVVW